MQSSSVLVAVRKPGSSEGAPLLVARNISLHVSGTALSLPATWSTLDAELLATTVPWLWLPATFGELDSHVITRTHPETSEVIVQLFINTSGLRESAVPYTATLPFVVNSDQTPWLVDVVLVVSAASSFIEWGHVLTGETCSAGGGSAPPPACTTHSLVCSEPPPSPPSPLLPWPTGTVD